MSDNNSPLVPFDTIEGVYTVPLKVFGDDRGSFAESFRKSWFPMVSWENMQTNRSISRAGILRGMHYHFHQIDYWFLMQGKIRVGLADLRPNSPTFRTSTTIDIDANDSVGLFIPVGVAHGFYALTDIILTYVVNQYYNGGADENSVRWNDPTLAIPWALDDEPFLSGRDQQAPFFDAIPVDKLPRL